MQYRTKDPSTSSSSNKPIIGLCLVNKVSDMLKIGATAVAAMSSMNSTLRQNASDQVFLDSMEREP